MTKKMKVIVAAVCILVCAALVAVWLVMRQKGKEQNIVTVVSYNKVVMEIDLTTVKETETITIGEPGAENIIQISPEGIGVIYADCPDQLCVYQGIRAHGPEPIVCLPHRLTIRFSDGGTESLDAVTGR